MSLINLRDRTINAKIVYYGTALSGKTTSLKHVHRVIDPQGRTELVSLNTQGDRTLFFDFLPIPLGSLGGFHVKLQAFTVPGQVKYALTRRYVLRGADGIIFVADSRPEAFEDNIVALRNLEENLEVNGIDRRIVPIFIQYNKRDVPAPVPVEHLREALNPAGVSDIATIATTGEGVFEAFSSLTGDMLVRLATEHRLADPTVLAANVAERFGEFREDYERLGGAHPADVPAPHSLAGAAAFTARRPAVIEVATVTGEQEVPDVEELLERAVETNMESARLLTELNETRTQLSDHVNHLAGLHATGVVIASELDSDRLLERVLEQATKTVGTTHGSVLLLDRDGGRLEERLVRGFSQDPIARRGGAEPALVQRVLAGDPFMITASEDPALLQPPGVDEPGPLAALVAPLVHQGEVLGALTAYLLVRARGAESDDRLRFLGAVAAQAAVAIENVRLYSRIEGFNRELERTVAERTQELEQANRELKQLDRMKDDFLASMSHELMTPLTSINGFAEILGTTAADDGAASATDRAEFAAIIQQESGRLTQTLQSVIDLSVLESGRLELQLEDVDLRDALAEAYRRQRPAFKERGVKVRVRVDEGMPAAVADHRWLAKALDALLSNAAKFSPADGEVHVTIYAESESAVVAIADTGSGVPETLRPVIFEKFKQLGDILTDKPTGLGLGLPTARLAIERLGGTVWYEPGAKAGSVFALMLPTRVAAPR